MKKAMINYIKNGVYDEIYTPKFAVKPLLKYLQNFKNKIIWECTDFGASNITKILKENGFNVVATHKKDGTNFFTWQPEKWDLIVTNPPYSLKNEFLQRAYELGKPFCFLLPITTLEGIARGKMFRKYGIEILVLDKRINFLQEMGVKKGSSCWFNVSWFCWQVLPEKLIFEKLEG